jgi:hypothetical protein
MPTEYEVVALEKRRLACCCRESSHDSWSLQLVARTDWVCHIPISVAIPHLKKTHNVSMQRKEKKAELKKNEEKRGEVIENTLFKEARDYLQFVFS